MIGKDVFANNSRKITDEIYNVKEQLELLAQSQNRINNNENSSYVKSLQSQTDMYKKMMSDYKRLLPILCKPPKWYRIEISNWRLKICQGTKTARRYG